MDRGHVLVVAVVAAAVGLFVFTQFSGSPDPEDLVGGGGYGRAGSGATGAPGYERGYGGSAGTDRADPRKPGVSKASGGADNPLRVAKRIGPAGRGSSATVIGGVGKEQKRRGVLGASGSRSRLPGGESGVSIAETGRPSEGISGSSGRQERRSDLVDFLAEQPGGKNDLFEDELDDDPEGENGDVVFSAPLNSETGTLANDDTPPLVEHDLEFGEEGVGVRFDGSSVLAFPDAGNVRGDAGTMTLEFEPEWSGAEGGDYSLINVRTPNDPTNSLRVFKNGRYLRFLFADNTGQERNIGYDMINWEPGEAHTVTATWGDSVTSLYIDNQLVGTNYYEGQLEIRPGTPLYLGSDVPEAPPSGANAIISNFRVFGRALSGDEVSSYRFPSNDG